MYLKQDYLKSFASPKSGTYRLDPGGLFPIDLGDGEHFVPVSVEKAIMHEAQGRSIGSYIMRLYNVHDIDARYRELERVLKKHERKTTVAVILFYMLGYRIDENYIVDGNHVKSLDEFIKTFLLPENEADEFSRFRILLTTRSGFKTYYEALKISEAEAERALKFLSQVIVPLANIQRIIIEEALMTMSGAQALRLVRPILSLLSKAREIIRFSRYGLEMARIYGNLPTARLLVRIITPNLERLLKLSLKALGLIGDLDTASKILAELAKMHASMAQIIEFQKELLKEGIILLEGWGDELVNETEQVASEAIKEIYQEVYGVELE